MNVSEDSDVIPFDIRTPTGFQAAVKSLTPLKFAEAVASLSEAERKKLSKTAQELYRESRPTESASTRSIRMLQVFAGRVAPPNPTFLLALLAVASKSAALKNLAQDVVAFAMAQSDSVTRETEPAAIRILCDRRPDWANDWLNVQLNSNRWTGSIGWESIRTLIQSGVCQRPATERYVRLFAWKAIEEDLTTQPDLLDDLWLLFEFDSLVFDVSSLDPVPMPASYTGQPRTTWPQRIVELVNSGHLDRKRLHSAILGSLWKDWRSTSLSGLAKFHDIVGFSDDERAAHLSDYIGFLAHPAPPVVGWAIRQVKSLVRHSAFDGSAVLDVIPHVFNIATKAQPVAALSLISTIVKAQERLQPLATSSLARALTHANTDVQQGALELIENWQKTALASPSKRLRKNSSREKSNSGESETASDDIRPANRLNAIAATLRSSLDQMSVVLRERASSLLASLDHELISESESTESMSCADSEPPGPTSEKSRTNLQTLTSELERRVDSLPDALCKPLKLKESLAAAIEGRPLPTINIDDVPRVLPFVPPVHPVKDIEELIDSIAGALEHVTSPMEIERILDGISRFGTNDTPEFAQRSEAVLHRLEERDQFLNSDSLRSQLMRVPMLASLLSFWLSQGRHQISWMNQLMFGSGRSVMDQLLNHRTEEIRRRLMNKESTAALLSLPTHEQGWIDPRELVCRLQVQQDSGVAYCRIDLTTALLRLAPDFREEALAQTGRLHDPVRDIVRYALGVEPEFTDLNRQFAPEWLAAGRSRNPHGDLFELAELPLPPGPNLVQAGSVQVDLHQIQFMLLNPGLNDGAMRARSVKLIPPTPAATAGPRQISGMLTEMVHTDTRYYAPSGWPDVWRATFWPARPDLAVAHAIPVLVRRLDATTSSWDPIAPLVQPLLRTDRGWSDVSLYAMCLTFFCRDAEARAVASDALIEGILDGRGGDPELLGRILSEFVHHSWPKLNRLTEILQTVGRVSSYAALVVATALESLIAAWNEIPRDGHLVLSLLLELLTGLKRGPSDLVVIRISSLSGKNKAALTAARLLALKSAEKPEIAQQALLEGVRSRIERAERSVGVP